MKWHVHCVSPTQSHLENWINDSEDVQNNMCPQFQSSFLLEILFLRD